MADRNALRTRLLSLLVAETRQLGEFAQLLEREQQILGQRDVEPLFAISEEKNRFARQFQQFADSRTAVLTQAGVEASREGVESLLDEADLPAWQTYLELAIRARNLNETNGLILTQRLAHNHQALAILMAHSDQPTVYGPDGASRTRPGSRSLGSY
ncbi:MAG: hypothetical protein CGU28_04955 [Candidatus Dactylopiibacterium carminicum]|uniref:Flagellar protein FlgN n=1 Tax=Candidatus Dactylopiibacterium carminicum TaxID=857335 RepID=A0A272EU17_9RHOO|nr:flagellar protein FlgN [Candidatus Dactylopiibacterium carminicum]KAF7599639.1 flagellar protein FlgN [Candidatus Dactylopiibacterium carminicum]PAS93583.1 MAG: hypothetical protein CGU29_07240 [Candidatus Dactylopiibacterium carminicum]PAS97424.1 MAG: hypothetical protein CGU28_04955 [Candidatus Dactylopiibacterium carminicum]PAS99640.1 MAG: hypothetical protein BSR46_06620 [Candidatus Dactylopiibacterium carminicum]